MAKRTLPQWLDELNNYGRLRIFFNEEEAKECQRALTRMKELVDLFDMPQESGSEPLAFLRKLSKEIEKNRVA